MHFFRNARSPILCYSSLCIHQCPNVLVFYIFFWLIPKDYVSYWLSFLLMMVMMFRTLDILSKYSCNPSSFSTLLWYNELHVVPIIWQSRYAKSLYFKRSINTYMKNKQRVLSRFQAGLVNGSFKNGTMFWSKNFRADSQAWLMNPPEPSPRTSGCGNETIWKKKVERWVSGRCKEVTESSLWDLLLLPVNWEDHINTVLCSLNKLHAPLPVFVWVTYCSWDD